MSLFRRSPAALLNLLVLQLTLQTSAWASVPGCAAMRHVAAAPLGVPAPAKAFASTQASTSSGHCLDQPVVAPPSAEVRLTGDASVQAARTVGTTRAQTRPAAPSEPHCATGLMSACGVGVCQAALAFDRTSATPNGMDAQPRVTMADPISPTSHDVAPIVPPPRG